MELKDIENFAILLCNKANDETSISNIVRKISLRKMTKWISKNIFPLLNPTNT